MRAKGSAQTGHHTPRRREREGVELDEDDDDPLAVLRVRRSASVHRADDEQGGPHSRTAADKDGPPTETVDIERVDDGAEKDCARPIGRSA